MSSASNAENLLPLTETVEPSDEPAVARVLRDARAAKTPVYPVGGGTNLGFGLRPTRPGIGLSTARLNHVVDYPHDDLTITVEAGLTMAELTKRLAAQRQWLPIDVPQPGRATVGGVVATNLCGPRRYAYGTIRDYLLGVRAVDGQGESFASGGRVVKNAAGYNIPRLLAGSLGTLGVITQVTFMVRPLPQRSALVLCDVADFEAVECLLVALNRSRTFPVAIELLAGRIRTGCPLAPLPEEGIARLIVGFDGGEAEVQWMSCRLLDAWRATGGAALTCVTGAGIGSVWKWLVNMSGNVQINVLPSAVVRVVGEIVRQVPGVTVQSHAGSGTIEAAWSDPAASGDAATGGGRSFARIVRETLRPIAVAAGGNMVVLSAPADAELTAADVWGSETNGAAVVRAIRDQFDPDGILNPGRFIFGNP